MALEFGMAAVMNGAALGGFIPYSGTFLVFLTIPVLP